MNSGKRPARRAILARIGSKNRPLATRQLVRPPSILSATILFLKCYGKCHGWEIKINSLSYSSADEAFFAVTVCPITGYILAHYFAISEQFWQICGRFRHNRNASVSLPLRHAAEQNTYDVLLRPTFLKTP